MTIFYQPVGTIDYNTYILKKVMLDDNKKFELMLTRRAKAYSSSSSAVYLKIGVFTLS